MSARVLPLCPRPPRLRSQDGRVLARLLVDLPPSMTTAEEREALQRAVGRAERDQEAGDLRARLADAEDRAAHAQGLLFKVLREGV